jgi:transcriptional regulator with XRE-family HTH domain
MKIAAITKLKHGVLFDASRKTGSQAALARHLGISAGTVGNWCNMLSAPPTKPTHDYPQEKLDDIERKLLVLTGLTLDEIFPLEMRCREFLKATKERTVYKEIKFTQLTDKKAKTLSIEMDPQLILAEEEESRRQQDYLRSHFEKLSSREKEILRHRLGLYGAERLTIKELAKRLGITVERVRQIEGRAKRNLANSLGFVDLDSIVR